MMLMGRAALAVAGPSSPRTPLAAFRCRRVQRKRKNRTMRKKMVALLSIGVTLSCGPVIAAIDFRGYDDDLMRDLDKTIKYFEPDITAKNADAARDDAAVLQEGFKYTEAFFAKNGAEDAVKISRDGSQRIADALKFVERNDFESAAAAARETTQLCKSCHDLYKKTIAR
jgi:hypothetical protein